MLYGAAEFSRDVDLCLPEDPGTLERLRRAADELEAEVVAVPPFRPEHLAEGLAVHFRCRHPDVAGLRIDVMTRMRGVEGFDALWSRRTTFTFADEVVEALSLPDLVAAKKTQRDKDWPMIARLVEGNYFTFRDEATGERLRFWLLELRAPALLVEVAGRHPDEARALAAVRGLLASATPDGLASGELGRAIRAEEDAEREADRRYWAPRRKRLEALRRAAR